MNLLEKNFPWISQSRPRVTTKYLNLNWVESLKGPVGVEFQCQCKKKKTIQTTQIQIDFSISAQFHSHSRRFPIKKEEHRMKETWDLNYNWMIFDISNTYIFIWHNLSAIWANKIYKFLYIKSSKISLTYIIVLLLLLLLSGTSPSGWCWFGSSGGIAIFTGAFSSQADCFVKIVIFRSNFSQKCLKDILLRRNVSRNFLGFWWLIALLLLTMFTRLNEINKLCELFQKACFLLFFDGTWQIKVSLDVTIWIFDSIFWKKIYIFR